MSSGLFRKEAQAAFFTTEARGGVLTVTPPSTVVVFGVMAGVFAAIIALAMLGKTDVYAEGRGVVRPDAPAIVLHAPFAGSVATVSRAAGERGRSGDPLVTLDVRPEAAAHATCAAQVDAERRDLGGLEARLRDWNETTAPARDASLALVLLSQIRTQREKVNGLAQKCDELARTVQKSKVVFPADASVDDVAVSPGAQVHEGEALATLVPATARLVGYVVVPEAYRRELAVGRPVRVKFDALPYDQVGVGAGRVTRLLETLPSSAGSFGGGGGGGGAAGDTTRAPSGAYAEIAIDAMPGGAQLRNGMTFTADVLARRAPIASLLFGGGGDGATSDAP